MNAREWFYSQPGFHNYPVTGETVRKTDEAMARLAKQLCPGCGLALNEDGGCNREGC